MHEPRIFICYRRQDGSERAHRLHDALVTHFGKDEVFIDLDLPAGADIRPFLTDKLKSCAVLLVVIGPHWLDMADEAGQRRLDNPSDWVRLELVIARDNGIPVVPLLVQGAAMPAAGDLPRELAWLADRNAQRLSDDEYWREDVRRLAARLETMLALKLVSAQSTLAAAGSRTPPAANAGARGRRLAAAAAALAILAAGLFVLTRSEPPLRIYSSLPRYELRQPFRVDQSGRPQDPGQSKRTDDIERAMQLALVEHGGRIAGREVEYVRLDASEADGLTPDSKVAANARRVSADDDAAVYLGDFTSTASQVSIPILSRAGVAQISPGSTRVGLTQSNDRSDINEPARYYPRRKGWPNGYRNFVRIVPPDTVQARSLVADIASNPRCRRIAMISDHSAYGDGLASDIRRFRARSRATFLFNEAVGPFGVYDHLIRQARATGADCFVYSGSRNPNTVEMFEKVALVLPPGATLYATDGGVNASFYDPSHHGLPARIAKQVRIMVPPRPRAKHRQFEKQFAAAYNEERPDPYAIYGYEAMQLALHAIERSRGGGRDAIVKALRNTVERKSYLGSYTIIGGDTDVQHYGVSRIANGRLTTPRLVRSRRHA